MGLCVNTLGEINILGGITYWRNNILEKQGNRER